MAKVINTTGKRKTAIARATFKAGAGKVSINGQALENYTPELMKLKIMEPLMLSGSACKKVDISVDINGGGITGQADAARMAIARGLLEWTKDKELEAKVRAYDINLLSYDPRRTEPRKPSRSSKGARRTKQLSKR